MLICSASGVRGLAPRDLDPSFAIRLTYSLIETLNVRRLVLGYDRRPTSVVLAKAVLSVARCSGVNVYDLGVCPTPVVLYVTKCLGADAAIIITGSHNPIEYNAFKVGSADGTFLDYSILREIWHNACRVRHIGFRGWGSIERFNGKSMYVKHLLEYFDTSNIIRRRFKLVFDCGGSSGLEILNLITKQLNIKMFTVDDGIPPQRPFEPNEKNLRRSVEIVRSLKADFGFAMDADCDRLVLITGSRVLRPDYTLALALEEYLRSEKSPVAVNIATSRIVEYVCRKYGCPLYYARVGEVNVVNAMRKYGCKIGGEGSSAGVIVRDFNFTRDGFAALMLVLRLLSEEGEIEGVVRQLPEYKHISVNVRVSKVYDRGKFLERLSGLRLNLPGMVRVTFMDGVRVDFADGSWVLVRPSGTEPIIRVIGEAKDMDGLERVRDAGMSIVRRCLEGEESG